MHEQATQVGQEIAQQATQFQESQALYSTLAPQLEQMMQNPTGFSAQELADLNATNVNVTGAQYASAQQQTNLVNSSENMAGLTSGVAAGEGAALRSAAAGQVASGATNIRLQNAQLQQQNKQAATSELMALQSGQGQMAIGIGNTENNAEQNAFSQANTVNQQQDALTQSLIGAGLGIGMTALTGGMSGLSGIGGQASTAGGW
jgi:hypothetical protein